MLKFFIAFIICCVANPAWAEHWVDTGGLTIDFQPGWQAMEPPKESSIAVFVLQRKSPDDSTVIQVMRMKGRPGPGFKGPAKSGLLEGLRQTGFTLVSYEERQDPGKAGIILVATHGSGMEMETRFLWNGQTMYKVTCSRHDTKSANVGKAILDSATLASTAAAPEAPATSGSAIDMHAWSVRIIEFGFYGLLAVGLLVLIRKIIRSKTPSDP